MNILPHKSWHVRTKKNIARVRKDEAKAAEEAKEIERRVALAAQESRTSFLRERAKKRFQEEEDPVVEKEEEGGEKDKTGDVTKVTFESASGLTQDDGHVNFFQDIEQGIKQKYETNEEHESEKKKEQEDYEKKIGYLQYLGQNSLEHSKERPWYESLPRPSPSEKPSATSSTEASLKDAKFKDFHDPLKDIRKYLHTPGVKAKMDKLAKKRPADSDSKTKKVNKAKKHKKSKKKHKHRRSRSRSSVELESDGEYEERKAENLARLRAERVEREKEESKKAERLMAKLRGETLPEDEKNNKIDPEKVNSGQVKSSAVRQKYNSQFNPHLARQNY